MFIRIIFNICFILNILVNISQSGSRTACEKSSFSDESLEVENRIVGGHRVPIEEAPFIVSIFYNGLMRASICGGSIISLHWVITAGHCAEPMKNNLRSFSIRSGSTLWEFSGFTHNINRTVIHKNFILETLQNDIALLQVTSPFRIGLSNVNKIALAGRDYNLIPLSFGIVYGWGGLRPARSSQIYPAYMNAVALPITDNETCQSMANIPGAGSVTERQLCAGFSEGGRDACQADSGGPFIQGNVLIGIVSWGDGCARRNEYGVYTKVSSYYNWLKRRAIEYNIDMSFSNKPINRYP